MKDLKTEEPSYEKLHKCNWHSDPVRETVEAYFALYMNKVVRGNFEVYSSNSPATDKQMKNSVLCPHTVDKIKLDKTSDCV